MKTKKEMCQCVGQDIRKSPQGKRKEGNREKDKPAK